MFYNDQYMVKALDREDIKNFRDFVKDINILDNEEISISEDSLEYVCNQLHMRDNIFLVYYKDKLIAYAGCMIFDPTNTQNASIQLMVHPMFRNRGIGSSLYNLVIQRARINNVRVLEARCKQRMQDSLRFAIRRGFNPTEYSWKMDLDMSTWNNEERINPQYVIKQVTQEDTEEYVKIMTDGFKKEGEPPYTERIVDMMFIQPSTYAFFLETNDVVVATAAIRIEEDINRAYIYNVAVYKQYRGMGYGKAMLEYCVNFIKKHNVAKASLLVHGQNTNALKLYKKIGFIEVDTDVALTANI